ncbi:protein FAR1-RELATED SEQUENCE 5-like [Silene latifolia]|uniref:protein FAR1-RELATED SEQUENCE 5-like n=1 Tax=Silene latifolia TaxID=37657 RepID=UPI003D77BA95
MDEMQIVQVNNVEECCEDVEDVGEEEFSKVLQGVGVDEFCRIVESQFTPYVGQQFDSIEEAVQFYKMYALACGFDVRKYTTKKWRDGTIRLKLLLKIGATKTYKMCKEHVNGFQNIGASVTDFKNFHRDVKCYINDRDGQLFIDRFKNMEETRDDFFFDYEVDVDGSLIRAIWADGVGRRNYSIYSDAVSFDPTYSTNKYDMVFTPFTGVDNHKRSVTFAGALIFREKDEYFDWVFSRFLVAMGGKEPEYIITDQGPGIISSVRHIFKTARHRFCMWHIMNKVPVKYGGNAKDFTDFTKKLNAIVWDEDIEPDEFDMRWCEIMKEHGVGPERDWFEEVYNKRRQWVMAHCRDLNMGSVMRTTQRSESENNFVKKFENNSGTLVEFWSRYESVIDQQRHTQKKLDNENRQTSPKLATRLPIESHGARVYTHVVFDVFQEEVIRSTTGLSARGFNARNGVEVTNLKDGMTERVYDIQYKPDINQYICNGVNKIPDAYVAKRWTQDAVGYASDVKDIIDGKEIEMTKLWSEVYETVGLLRDRDKTDVERLGILIREFREELRPSVDELTKEQEIEQLLGCKPIEKIIILPPKQAKNKGSGKRMLSTKSKVNAKNAKPKRMCNNCKQMAHHDKRNCPNPFAECPPISVQSSSEESENEAEEEEDWE